jgi:cell division protein FtsA
MADFPIVAALEMGTSKVVAMVGELRDDGNVMIIGKGEQPSSGIRKGEVTDLENAMAGVKGALKEAEVQSDVEINQLWLAVSGGHIECLSHSGLVPVRSPGEGVTKEDIEDVKEMAGRVSLPDNRWVLDTITGNFRVDDQLNILRPLGMCGSQLGLDVLVVHGEANRIQNARTVIEDIPMDVMGLAFGGLCSALGALTPAQKESGVLVIDLGGGTTDYAVFANHEVAAGGSISVGGEHVTNDIAMAFCIPHRQAEALKKRSGSAVIRSVRGPATVTLHPEGGFSGRTVSLHTLHAVMNARMDETLQLVRQSLAAVGAMRSLNGGIVLTGGGARMEGLAELAARIFRRPCVVGVPFGFGAPPAAIDGPEYAACCGLVRYGFLRGGATGRRSGGWLGTIKSIMSKR